MKGYMLAKHVGCSPTHMTYLENGHRGLCDDMLATIAKVLNVDVERLKTGDFEILAVIRADGRLVAEDGRVLGSIDCSQVAGERPVRARIIFDV